MEKLKNLKNSSLVKFVIALFVVGVLTGFIFYLIYKPDITGYILNFKDLIINSHHNTYIYNILVVSSIFVLSISVIGIPIMIFYIFYEGMSIGFTFALFISINSFKGLLFYSIFFILTKVVFILVILYFSIIALRYVAKFLDSVISKNREELYKTIVFHFYRFVIIFLIILMNSTLIYLFANKILALCIGLI